MCYGLRLPDFSLLLQLAINTLASSSSSLEMNNLAIPEPRAFPCIASGNTLFFFDLKVCCDNISNSRIGNLRIFVDYRFNFD
ncbi:hypothetical protein SOVF_171750 [Spinacia oleracea]|nr:hypothetical protein SOVF_171750 [Spinacia oleracea]